MADTWESVQLRGRYFWQHQRGTSEMPHLKWKRRARKSNYCRTILVIQNNNCPPANLDLTVGKSVWYRSSRDVLIPFRIVSYRPPSRA
jgi:hypothetical protein